MLFLVFLTINIKRYYKTRTKQCWMQHLHVQYKKQTWPQSRDSRQ